MSQQGGLVDRRDAAAAHDHGHADLAPLGVGHAEHRHFGHAGMRQQHFLDLARVDVRAARDVHVRFAAGDGEQAALVQAPEVAGVEPATAQGLGSGLGVAVVAGEDGRPAAADFADAAGRYRLQVGVEHGHFHAGAWPAAGADVGVGVGIVGAVHLARQHRDAARHFTETEVLHQHQPELLQRKLLVGAVHRCAGINQVAQRAVVVAIEAVMLDQQLNDRRHREQVADAVLLHQPPEKLGVELVARHQDGGGAAGDIQQHVDAGAVRQRCDRDRTVALRRAWDQIGQVVGNDEGHLPVRQHRGLGPTGRAGGVEEPQRIVRADPGFVRTLAQVLLYQAVDVGLAVGRRTDPDHVGQRWRGRAHGVDMAGEAGLRDHRHRCARAAEVSHFGRRQAKVGRHPDATQAKRHPTALEHGQVVARMHEDAVALLQAALAQRIHHCIDTCVDLAPCPAALAVDQTDVVREKPGRVREQAPEIHHRRRVPEAALVRHAAALWIHTASSTLR